MTEPTSLTCARCGKHVRLPKPHGGLCCACAETLLDRATLDAARAPLPDSDLAGLREAVIHAARDVDGMWFPQDDNWTGTDLTFWGPEAGEALRDLRTATTALDDFESAKAKEPG
jgi:hypothetical protein